MQKNKKILKILSIVLASLLFTLEAQAICPETSPVGMMLCYDFENWTGDRYTTPNYPFSSGYTEYCERHDDATEVVSEHDGWTANTGNYFLLRNNAIVDYGRADSGSSTTLVDDDLGRATGFWNGQPILLTRNGEEYERTVQDWNLEITTLTFDAPLSFAIDNTVTYRVGFRLDVPGIPGGTVNDNGNIGFNGDRCSQNDFVMADDINSGEVFISFFARHNPGFYGEYILGDGRSSDPYPGTKWIRVNCLGDSGDVFMHLGAGPGTEDTNMRLYQATEGYMDNQPILEAYNGDWHQYAIYINFNIGELYGWYDVDSPTRENATVNFVAPDGAIGSCTDPNRFVIQGNFCAKYPMETNFHALDDLEIWDRLPTSVDCSALNNQTDCEINSCNYCDEACQSETCTVTIRADVDNNSSINTTDAMLTLRNSLGLDMSQTTWQNSDTTGDVDCNGNSNSTDAMLLLRYSLGLDMSGTEWCE